MHLRHISMAFVFITTFILLAGLAKAQSQPNPKDVVGPTECTDCHQEQKSSQDCLLCHRYHQK